MESRLARLAARRGVVAATFAAVAFGACLDPNLGPPPDAADDGAADADADVDADVDADNDADADTPGPGELCASCQLAEECGGDGDYCLINNNTGETFCGAACGEGWSCPASFVCVFVGGVPPIYQCVPQTGTCLGGPDPTCDPACVEPQQCRSGQCVDPDDFESDLAYCVELTNGYRAEHGRPPLARAADLEACAAQGAEEDAGTGMAHGHFQRTMGCGVSDAENEIPGWPLSMYGSVRAIIQGGLEMMMNEGPGGGHYENILGDHTAVGCGVFVTAAGEVWVAQDFR